MFKLERDKAKYVQLEMNGEILNISVGGVKQLQDFIHAQERLVEVQKKVDNLQVSDNHIPINWHPFWLFIKHWDAINFFPP